MPYAKTNTHRRVVSTTNTHAYSHSRVRRRAGEVKYEFSENWYIIFCSRRLAASIVVIASRNREHKVHCTVHAHNKKKNCDNQLTTLRLDRAGKVTTTTTTTATSTADTGHTRFEMVIILLHYILTRFVLIHLAVTTAITQLLPPPSDTIIPCTYEKNTINKKEITIMIHRVKPDNVGRVIENSKNV